MTEVDVTHALAIVPRTPEAAIQEIQRLRQIVETLYRGNEANKAILVKDKDYGIIPGTGKDPVLLLPGMEKLLRVFNAVPQYIERRAIVDYDKDLFHYEYECRLVDADTGQAIPGGVGVGACTSRESSFRYRQGQRTCPQCGEAAIRKGSDQYGGGWYCNRKQGGCGAAWKDRDDAAMVAQINAMPVGRIENPDVADQVNAILKRAKKRSLGDAVKGMACVSDYFTVDLEDAAPSRDDYYDSPASREPDMAPAKPKTPPKTETKTNGATPESKPGESGELAMDVLIDTNERRKAFFDLCQKNGSSSVKAMPLLKKAFPGVELNKLYLGQALAALFPDKYAWDKPSAPPAEAEGTKEEEEEFNF